MKLTLLFTLLLASTCMFAGAQSTGTLTLSPSHTISTAPVVEGKQTVQPLLEGEKVRLAAARKKVQEAQKELDRVELDIKYSHGYSPARAGWCDTSETNVEFWGDYVLIEIVPMNGCPVTW